MIAPDFPGAAELIETLDRSVAAGDPAATTSTVKRTLCELIQGKILQLPDSAQVPDPDCYARHLIYKSPEHGYVIVAMVWGPGQGTPLHDHAGVWCVEGVWRGQLEVVQYKLLEQTGTSYRFEAQETMHAGPGTAGSLIPPYEYHTITNVVPDESSITLHVYGAELDGCCIFEPRGSGWYERREKALAYAG